jgi:hypothetical protein
MGCLVAGTAGAEPPAPLTKEKQDKLRSGIGYFKKPTGCSVTTR